jgi:hypothetical protein
VNDLFGTDCSSSSEAEEPKSKRKKTESKKRKANSRNTSAQSRKSDEVSSVKRQKTTKTSSPPIIENKIVEIKVGQKRKTPPSAQKKSQRSRRTEIVAAAKAVAEKAIPLGRCLRSSPKFKEKEKSPIKTPIKSPIKQLDIPPTPPNQAASLLKENTISYPSEIIQPFSSNGHHNCSDRLPPHLTITPPSEPPLPFNILPAPFGFPEPTPIKFRKGYNQSQDTFSFITPAEMMSLITPMKGPSTSTISPPSLPPTPRYMVQDYMDTDSNSVSNFQMFRNSSDGLDRLCQTDTLNTPFKTGPPPTPGNDFSYDERAPGTITISTLYPSQHVILDQNKVTSPPVPPYVSISRTNNNFNVIVSKP